MSRQFSITMATNVKTSRKEYSPIFVKIDGASLQCSTVPEQQYEFGVQGKWLYVQFLASNNDFPYERVS